jgi:integrase
LVVNRQSGTYYLQAKVAGKFYRLSLRTKDARVAKMKRDDMLKTLRRKARESRDAEIRTVGDAIAFAESRVAQPHLKDSSKEDYAQTFRFLREALPVDLRGRHWGEREAAEAWRKATERFGAVRANKALARMRQIGGILVEQGERSTNPAAGLQPIRSRRIIREMPPPETIEAIIGYVRSRNLRNSEESANFIGFLAYSGVRVAEARAVRWRDMKDGLIRVKGGDGGTKNRRDRDVPVIAKLAETLERMRHFPPEPIRPDRPLFTLVSPRHALANACERLGVEHLRVHDLRHFFATWCIQSGVDIPTVAGWLGHTDGGVLLMKTYSHLAARHSFAQARKVR